MNRHKNTQPVVCQPSRVGGRQEPAAFQACTCHGPPCIGGQQQGQTCHGLRGILRIHPDPTGPD